MTLGLKLKMIFNFRKFEKESIMLSLNLSRQRLLALSLLILSAASLAFAQTSTNDIKGIVKDQNGAVIAGASARLLNLAGNVVAQSQTDNAGEFHLSGSANGSYTLRVSKQGMAESVREIIFNGAALQSVEIVLEPAALEEQVNVSAGNAFVSAESETAAKMPVPLRDLPQSVEVVNQQLMKAQGVRSMQDALYNVTAVSVAQGEGRRDQFFIRGFNAIGDQFIDGVRDDAPYYRDLANIERIEVLKGPAAVLYGRGSSGGLINRITKRPSLDGRFGGLDFAFGSYNLKRGAFDLGQPIITGKLALRLVGAYEKSASFRHFYFQDRYNLAPSLAWHPTKKTDLLAQYEYLNDHRLPDRGLPSFRGRPVDVPISTYYGYPQKDSITNRVSSQAVRAEHRFNDSWLVRNLFRHTAYSNNFYNTGPNGVSLVKGEPRVARFQYNGNSRQQNYFNQTEAIGALKTFALKHTILFGAEFGAQDKRAATFRNSKASSVSLFNPVLTEPINTNIPTTYNGFTGRVVGFYFQDQITFTRNLKALVGARLDNFRQQLDDLTGLTEKLGRTDRQWSPRAGLVYQPRQWLSLYTSYTRSFQPSGENLSLAANNEELGPEMTRNYEAGVKAEIPRSRMSTTVAVFRLERDNIKTTDPRDPTRLLLVGQQRTDGIEATLSGSPTRKLEIYAGYALLSARVLRSNNVSAGVPLAGRRVGLIPQSSGNLWLSYSLPKQFRLGLGAFARSSVFTSTNNLVTLPGYARFDASLSWRKERYEFGVNFKNITNRRYYETSNGDNGIMPGAPASASLTLRYHW